MSGIRRGALAIDFWQRVVQDERISQPFRQETLRHAERLMAQHETEVPATEEPIFQRPG